MSATLALPRPAGRRQLAAVLLAAVAVTSLPTLGSALRARAQAGVKWDFAAQPAPKIDPGLTATGNSPVRVVVQATGAGAVAEATAVLTRNGGRVEKSLPIIDGVAATVPGSSLTAIAASPAVRAITANRRVRFEEMTYDDSTTSSSYVKNSGATKAWSQGRLGTGVGVAVIDTGISQMRDLAGRIVHGPDLSGEGTLVDTYGHGTVMAGVIGGSGADSEGQSGGARTGVAPKSTLIAVKTAGRNGAVDVSTILQAMHFVSAYKEQFNIKVLNLSWGTPSTQSPALDPLNYGVERLWRQGIVVVVAAGNSGSLPGTVNKPGDDPLVITVGAYDDKGNLDPADDSIPAWSSRGPTAAGLTKPDLVAPGRTLVATRSYGSYIEANNPKALKSPSYIKGSGTSQAAAVVSGLAALLLEARPELSPDQVKAALKKTAAPISGHGANDQGSGRVNLGAALGADPGPVSQQSETSTGLGSIELSRGGRNVQTDCGNNGTTEVIVGEIDVRCEGWNGSSWTGSSWTGSSWTGSSWTGSSWTGSSWTGSSWTGSSWTGSSWTGGSWTGSSWTGSSWTGSSWTGSSWTGSSWTGSSWTGSSWTGSSWTGSSWTTDQFLTAFWGPRPKYNQHLPGEVSEAPPPGCSVALAPAGRCVL